MTSKTMQKVPPIRLEYKQKGRQVYVEPVDENRFMVSVETAIRACQKLELEEQFTRQFAYLREILAGWLVAHRRKVKHAYLTIADAGLLFLVVTKSAQYDGPLEGELTSLDLDIAQNPQLDLIAMEVLALPKSSPANFESFLAPEMTLEYHHAN